MIQKELPIRSGTTVEWADSDASDGAAAPILETGEVGVDTTTGQLAIGDGATAFAALARHYPIELVRGIVLVAGTKVTANTRITATTIIIPVYRTLGTVTAAKIITVSRSAGVSFTLTSTDNTDTSTLDVLLIQP